MKQGLDVLAGHIVLPLQSQGSFLLVYSIYAKLS